MASWDVSTRAQRFLWRIYEKGDELAVTLRGEVMDPDHVAVSPDARLIALSENNTVALWDLENRALLISFALSDGRHRWRSMPTAIDCCGSHRRDISHRRRSRSLIARACRIAARELTPAEEKRYLEGVSSPLRCGALPH